MGGGRLWPLQEKERKRGREKEMGEERREGEGGSGSIVMMESNSILLHAEYSPGGLFPLPEHSRTAESFGLA